MGLRGKNRSGYNLALLYALEVKYELEARLAREPALWQPLPRQRPDQFLHWVTHCLATLGLPGNVTQRELLEVLETKRLAHVAQALRYVLEASSLETPESAMLGEPGEHETKERHPQVRKYAKVVAASLDWAWRHALERVLQEQEAVPAGTVLLGGLPLNIGILGKQVFSELPELQALGGYQELSVSQFFALACGNLPQPPEPWRDALGELARLNDDELQLLKSLSEAQLEQLRSLEVQAAALVATEGKSYSSAQWQAITGLLAAISHEEYQEVITSLADLQRLPARERQPYLASSLKTLRSGNVSLKFLIAHGASRGKRFLRMLRKIDQPTWRLVPMLDEELLRLFASQELKPRLWRKLQRWPREQVRELRTLLQEKDLWVSAYAADAHTVAELLKMRSAAQLYLADLFPYTIAYLTGLYQHNLEALLLEDVSEVEASARALHKRVKARLVADLVKDPQEEPSKTCAKTVKTVQQMLD